MKLAELDRGCHGTQVELLQHMLNNALHLRPALELDGMFGPRTEQVVRRYQARERLASDGVVGNATWLSLGAKPSIAPRPAPQPIVHPAPVARAAARPAQLIHLAAAPAPKKAPVKRHVPLVGAAPVLASGDSPWMKIASAEMGIHERTHDGTQRIIEYHSTVSGHFKSDQIAWCSSFVNWCLKQVGITGTNNAAAASWAHWGIALTEPRYGCIIQLHHAARGHDASTGSSSGNHVAFFLKQDAGHIELLGGNQSDSVKVSRFPTASYQIAAMRWPGK